jgi:hypothetical protein
MTFKPSQEQRVLVEQMLSAGASVAQMVPHIKDPSSGRPLPIAVFRKAFKSALHVAPLYRAAVQLQILIRDACRGDAVAATVYFDYFTMDGILGADGKPAGSLSRGRAELEKLPAQIAEWRKAVKITLRKQQRARRERFRRECLAFARAQPPNGDEMPVAG